MHLVTDFRCKNQILMRDQDALRRWLLAMAARIGMNVFGEPLVVDYPFPEREGTALSATCFLGESSIGAHTYPEFGHVSLDVFACKEYDADDAMRYISHCWQRIGMMKGIILDRGINPETGEPISLRIRRTILLPYVYSI